MSCSTAATSTPSHLAASSFDNASGMAMMLEIARHYAAIPQAQRRRTMTFLTTSDHHHGSVGVKWVHDNFDFSKTAVIGLPTTFCKISQRENAA